MSIQGSINQGINMASILYRLSPEYEQKVKRKQTIKGMKENVKSLKELQGQNTEATGALSEITKIVGDSASVLSEKKKEELKNAISDSRELMGKRLESAEDLLDNIFNSRTELFGKDLTDSEKEEVQKYYEEFKKNYKEFKDSSRNYHKAMGEYDEAIKKDDLEREQREKEKAEGIVHKEELDWDTDFDEDGAYVSRINKENKPVKENLSTTEEDDSPVMENYEASPEVKAAQSVMKAQQRSELYKQRMETARQHLRKQYEKGEFDAYEYGKAMAENDLLRRDI